jgi:amino acid transporter
LAEKKLFPRTTSGLVRGIGPITALFVTIAFAVGYQWQVDVYSFAGLSPLPDNLWVAGIPPEVMAVFITGIIVIIISLGYSIIVSAAPRSGGGYVLISRILGPFAGFIGSWFLLFYYTTAFGTIAVKVFEQSFWYPTFGPSLGITPVVPGYNDVGFVAGGLCLIVLFTVIATLGVRVISYTLQLLVWVPVALTLLVLYLLGLAMANPAILQNGISVWAQWHGMAGVTADTYMKAALAQGLDSSSVGDYWTAVSVSILGAYYAYTGYWGNTFVAGEIRDPGRNLPKVLLLAPVIVVIMYVVMAAFGTYAAAAVGQTTLANGHVWSFFDAYSYLFWVGSSQQAGLPVFKISVTTVASMVAAGAGLGFLNFLLFGFAVLWIVNDLPVMVLVCSRVVFAMSFDRLLPVSLSKVSGRFNSPAYATIVVGIVSVLGALGYSGILCEGGSWYPGGSFGNFLTNFFFNGVLSDDIMELIFLTLFSLAVVLFPFRMRRTFEEASFKPGGKLGVVTIGLAGLIGNLSIAWVILTSPSDTYSIFSPSSSDWFCIGFTVVLGVIAALIYAYYRFGPSSRQVDYSAIFSEIPPE